MEQKLFFKMWVVALCLLGVMASIAYVYDSGAAEARAEQEEHGTFVVEQEEMLNALAMLLERGGATLLFRDGRACEMRPGEGGQMVHYTCPDEPGVVLSTEAADLVRELQGIIPK